MIVLRCFVFTLVFPFFSRACLVVVSSVYLILRYCLAFFGGGDDNVNFPFRLLQIPVPA